LALGGSEEVCGAFARGKVHRIRLSGAMILPGLIDGHTHMMMGALSLRSVDLRGVRSREEFVRRIRLWMEENPSSHWILGGLWDDSLWGEPPHRGWVDDLTGDRPLFLIRHDMHSALANSRALELAGIGAETPDPDGGRIVRDPESGHPTGLLLERAMELVQRHIPAPDDEERAGLLHRALRKAASLGLTAVQDIALDWKEVSAYRTAMEVEGVGLHVHLRVPMEALDAYKASLDEPWPERLIPAGLKAWTDGSLGSATAWLHEPYVGTQDRGVPWIQDPKSFKEGVLRAASLEIPISLHAIGDAAIDYCLDCFRTCIEEGIGSAPLRIEHFQHPSEEALLRVDHPRLIVSMQPVHLRTDARLAEERLGPWRARLSYPLRSLMDRRCTVVFGSDWPVADLNPFLGIYTAVTRQEKEGREGWIPLERIDVPQALAAYTRNAAHAAGLRDVTGELRPGLRADLTVIDQDITAVSPEEIPRTSVLMTVVGGKIVYEGF